MLNKMRKKLLKKRYLKANAMKAYAKKLRKFMISVMVPLMGLYSLKSL